MKLHNTIIIFISFIYCFLCFLPVNSLAYKEPQKDDFVKNAKVTGLLLQEHMILGIPCDEAQKKYNLQIKEGISKDEVELLPPLEYDENMKKGEIVANTFSGGYCYKGKLANLSKIVSVSDLNFDREKYMGEFVETHGNPYKVVDTGIEYTVTYNDMYLLFEISFVKLDDFKKSYIKYTVSDKTEIFAN